MFTVVCGCNQSTCAPTAAVSFYMIFPTFPGRFAVSCRRNRALLSPSSPPTKESRRKERKTGNKTEASSRQEIGRRNGKWGGRSWDPPSPGIVSPPPFVARRKVRTLSSWKSALTAGARGGFHPRAPPQDSYLRGLGPAFGGKVVAGLSLSTPAPPALVERISSGRGVARKELVTSAGQRFSFFPEIREEVVSL